MRKNFSQELFVTFGAAHVSSAVHFGHPIREEGLAGNEAIVAGHECPAGLEEFTRGRCYTNNGGVVDMMKEIARDDAVISLKGRTEGAGVRLDKTGIRSAQFPGRADVGVAQIDAGVLDILKIGKKRARTAADVQNLCAFERLDVVIDKRAVEAISADKLLKQIVEEGIVQDGPDAGSDLRHGDMLSQVLLIPS